MNASCLLDNYAAKEAIEDACAIRIIDPVAPLNNVTKNSLSIRRLDHR